MRAALFTTTTWSPPPPCDSTLAPASLTQMRPEPLLVSGDWAGSCAMPLAARRSPKRSFCQATSPLTAVTSSACAIFAEQVRGGDVGERIGLPGAGDGDGDHEDDGRQADERGEDEDSGAHARSPFALRASCC